MKCPRCKARVSSKGNYCPQCGRPIAAAEIRLPEAERRQVTVLFCDLVGSTALAARLDPEDLRALMASYHRDCCRAIEDAGGFVARHMGDGILAYFGYPRAREDDPERAVQAGLAAIEAIGGLHASDGKPLQGRVAIATGIVVVGDLIGGGVAQERQIVGETPNLAARLLSVAEPGSVVIGPATRRLLGGLFECHELGQFPLKGFGEPVAAFRVVRPREVESRFEARHEHGVAPLVGREQELELLHQRWREAQSGEGQVTIVSGEAGFGKSHLVRALQDRLEQERHIRLRQACSPQHQDSTLYPVIAQLARAAGLARDDTPEAKLAKLEVLLAPSGITAEQIGLIAGVLSVHTGDKYRLGDMSPYRRKKKTFEALIAPVTSLAESQPLLMIYEDAHWSDPTSQELLGLTVARVRRLPILLVITARPEFRPPWMNEPHVTTVSLSRLDRISTEALIDVVSGGHTLPLDLRTQILERTDGVPLFVEELTKLVLERDGSGQMRARAIPTTLQDSLMARIDRLPLARNVVQTGAALGREFTHDMLRVCAGLSEERLRSALRQLVRSGLVFRRDNSPASAYRFKHALVEDAAYQTMLKGQRIQLHARIADAFERHFPDMAETQPETLARHLAAAGEAERAIEYWLSAGQREMQRSALSEAINHYTAGIRLVADVNDVARRARLEARLQAHLGFALIAAKGYGSPEAEAAFTRAQELSQGTGDTEPLVRALRGITLFRLTIGDLPAAKVLAGQLLQAAERTDDDELLMVASSMLSMMLFFSGDFEQSARERGRLRIPYDPAQRRRIVARFGEDTPSTTSSFHGCLLGLQGRLDDGWSAVRDGIAWACSTGHPYSVANATFRAGVYATIVGDGPAACSLAKQALAIADELGFIQILAGANLVLGWGLAVLGDAAEGIGRAQEGAALTRRIGLRCGTPHAMSLVSGAMLAGGRVDAAIEAADRGLSLGTQMTEHAWDGLLHCCRGDALAAAGRMEEADTDYHNAVAWSRERSAMFGELYAAVRLARLWSRHPRGSAARQRLEGMYRRLGQGLDNPVVKQARALLDKVPAG